MFIGHNSSSRYQLILINVHEYLHIGYLSSIRAINLLQSIYLLSFVHIRRLLFIACVFRNIYKDF